MLESKLESKDLLRELSLDSGVSGYEATVAGRVVDAFKDLCDEVRTDPLGNVIAIKRSSGYQKGPRVMLAAHMDEIGLVVTKIEDGGFLRFNQIGGFDQRTLLGQEVQVHGRGEERIFGIIGATPPHLTKPEDRRKSIPMSELYIDLGMPADKVAERVSVGDIITLRREFIEMGKGLVAGKAMDDRAGVVAMFSALKWLIRLNWNGEVYAVATVQEEVGIRGALVSSYSLNPDIGIAIDVCHGEMPGVSEDRGHPLGKGPILEIGPQVHPKIFDRLKEVAEDAAIAYGVEVGTSPQGTDAFALQMARDGLPTALISLPLKYMHTSVETLAMDDVEKCGKLIAYFVASLDDRFVEGLRCF